jgi:protein-S-isoprenylcysteine O-methyltransferase Ste14
MNKGSVTKKEREMTPLHVISHILVIIFAFGEVFLTILFYNKVGVDILRNIGWIILFVSAILGWVPIFQFRRMGGVQKNQSYVKTTKLVRSGIYSVIRHPQFLGGILLGLSLILITTHWSVAVTGIVVMFIFAMGVVEGDRSALMKFGEEYRKYMNDVPMINILWGLIKLIKLKGKR